MRARCFTTALAVLIAGTSARAAQRDATLPIPEMEIPGGLAILAPLGLPADQDRGTLVAALVRALQSTTATPGPTLAARASEVAAELKLVDAFRSVWLGRVPPEGLSREMTATRQGRDLASTALEPIGLRLRQRQRVWTAEPAEGRDADARRRALGRAGVDSAAVAAAFNAGETVRPEVPTGTVPLPLSPSVLAQALQRNVAGRAIFGELLGDPRAMLLLRGLTALDRGTLAFLEANPEIVGQLYREAPGAFAMFGRSLVVREGEVVPPGPPSARYLWRLLVEEDPSRPDRFIRAVFGRDAGRLAYLYDTIAGLDPARQQFVFGLATVATSERPDRFRELHRVFVTLDDAWRVEDQPFARRPHEAVQALQHIEVDEEGIPLGPRWRRFWQDAFAGGDLPADPARAVRDVERDGVINAAWLAERLSDTVMTTRADRLDQWLFAQRVFPAPALDTLPAVLVAVHAHARYRAPLLAVERLGVRSPAIYAAVGRRAEQIASIGDERRATIALIQFQGALAIVAQARLAGSIAPEPTAALVAGLAALPLASDQYHAAVVEWMKTALIPALPPIAPVAGDEMEARLVAALAGEGRDEAELAFDWEGERVRLAAGASARRRITEVRVRQGTLALDTVIDFAALVRDIERGGAELTIEDARRFAVTLREVAAELKPASPSPLFTDRLPDMRRQIDRAISELARLNRPGDLRRLPRIAAPLLATVDVLTADVIGSLAYAPHLGEASGVAMLGEDMSRWHDFGLASAVAETRRRAAWQLPLEATGAAGRPRHLAGAMLNIDLALARLRLSRLDEDLPMPPSLLGGDIEALTHAVVLVDPAATSDADRDEIAAALARGRARIAPRVTDASGLEALAIEAGMSPGRRQALGWMAGHESDRVAEVFTLLETLRLGQPSLVRPHAWGVAQTAVTGCLCLGLPALTPWASRSGRLGAGVLAPRVPDLTLRVTDVLADLRVPATLLATVMEYATQSLIDAARLWHAEDEPSLVGQIRGLSREQVEDYIAALVGRRVLVPDGGR